MIGALRGRHHAPAASPDVAELGGDLCSTAWGLHQKDRQHWPAQVLVVGVIQGQVAICRDLREQHFQLLATLIHLKSQAHVDLARRAWRTVEEGERTDGFRLARVFGAEAENDKCIDPLPRLGYK